MKMLKGIARLLTKIFLASPRLRGEGVGGGEGEDIRITSRLTELP